MGGIVYTSPLLGKTDSDGGTVQATIKCQKVVTNKKCIVLPSLRTCFPIQDNCYASFSCNSN